MATRVVFVLPTYLPESFGGAEQQARKLGMALARLGVKVRLLAPRLHRQTVETEQDGPIAVRRFRVGKLPNLGGRHMASFLWWNAQVIAWLVRHRTEYDLIHVVHGRLHALPAVIAGALLRKPTLIKIGRGGENQFDLDLVKRKRLFGPWYASTLLRHTTGYVANSRVIVEDLLRWQVAADRIHEIPNGVEIPGLPTEVLAPEPAHLIYLGRLDPEKSVDVLIKGMARLPDDSQVRLTIVGDGLCRQELETLVARLGVQNRVKFTGAVTDTARELRAANIFVSSSVSEGMSNALLEAMSFGLMPLVSLVSGVSDIVEDNVSGLLFEPGDLDAFVTRLHAALAMSEQERHAFGLRARASVASRFGIDHVAARHLTLYRKLASAQLWSGSSHS